MLTMSLYGLGLSYIWLQNNMGRYVKQSWNHCKLRWPNFYISLYKVRGWEIFQKANHDLAKKRSFLRKSEILSSIEFLMIFYFEPIIELRAIKKTFGYPFLF